MTGTQASSLLAALFIVFAPGCKASDFEAHCYSNATRGEGDAAELTGYQCFSKRATCERRQAEKAKALAALPDALYSVGACEKTTAMYCAKASEAASFTVCAPTQASCDAVARYSASHERPTEACKKMTSAELGEMKRAQQQRMKARQ